MTDSLLLFANNAIGTIAQALSFSGTTIVLDAGQGDLFPGLSSGQTFFGTLSNADGTLTEIVLVTARVTDTLTVTRGQDGTSALNWPAESFFRLLVTRGTLQAFPQWSQVGEGIPYKQVDLGAGDGTVVLDLGNLPPMAPTVMIALTAAAPIAISNITGATLGLSVILSVLEGSSAISIPLNTAPFFLSNISGASGWPGYPLSSITLFYNPLNATYKWVEQARTWRTS